MQQSGKSRQVCHSLALACCVWLIALGRANAQTQEFLELKAKAVEVVRAGQAVVGQSAAASRDGRVHRIVRIADLPWIESLGESSSSIALPEVRHLQFVPPDAVLISAPAGFDDEFSSPVFRLESKLSPDLAAGARHFLAVFYPDVDMNEARALVLAAGGLPEERPDVRANELLVAGTYQAAEAIAALDETAWVYPANAELTHGAPVAGCLGAITSAGWVGEYVAKVGQGWDGAGLGAANLTYGFQALSSKLPPDATRAEFERALAEWSARAQINFTPGASANAQRHLNVLFASGSHGDGYNFDGSGKVLAHTFYPSPPNPEPIAGDVHFDGDEPWKLGADVDFYSVALHELGHALGLGHSDKPSAVMYPYYKRVTSLTDEDVSALLTLYAARNASNPGAPTTPSTPASPSPNPAAPTPNPAPNPTPTPNPPPGSPNPAPSPTNDSTPPTLTIVSPAGSAITTADFLTIQGTAIDNTGVARITWQLRGGTENVASGTERWSANVPLIRGTNYVTLRAYDATGNSSWRAITISRR